MNPKTIAIIGLGLMGGSLAARCRRQFPKAKVIGITRNAAALREARRKRWIHEGTHNLRRGIRNADLIILCTPVDTFPKILSLIDRSLHSAALVTDVGSVKGALLNWIEKRKWKRIQFVGAHPMVGSHRRGIQASSPHLYDHGFTFLVRSRKTNSSSYAAAKSFWKKITPRVIEISADEHDKITSEISHLPHAAAVCLVLAAQKKSLRYAASGFRDTTRIALGDASVWAPIFRSNQKAILKALNFFEKKLGILRQALRAKKDSAMRRILNQAAFLRKQI